YDGITDLYVSHRDPSQVRRKNPLALLQTGAGHHGVEPSRLEEAIDLKGVADDVVLRLAGPFGFSLHAHRLILGPEKVDTSDSSEGVEDRRDRKVCDHLLDGV